MASGLTSVTTSGTSGSIRQADELSITVAPAAANLGAIAFEVDPPAENRAIWRPETSAVAASSTTTSRPAKVSVLPAERAEAKKRISSMGKARSARIARMTDAHLAGGSDDADPEAGHQRPVPP